MENTAFQFNWKHNKVSQKNFEEVGWTMSQPVVLEAARFDSRAHRLRNFWSNLGEPQKLAAAVRQMIGPAGRLVRDILQEERQEVPVSNDDKYPWYPCNVKGEARQAWPTLMAYQGSFRAGKPGTVWDNTAGNFDEPSAVERERAMGCYDQDTAIAQVTEQQRRAMLGRSMDAHCTQALYGVAREWWCTEEPLQCTVVQEPEDACLVALFGMAAGWWMLGGSEEGWGMVPMLVQYCESTCDAGGGTVV